MYDTPGIAVLEPAPEKSQRRAAGIILRKQLGRADLETWKTQLGQMREYSRDNHAALLEELKASLGQYPGATLTICSNAKEAAEYIKGAAGTGLASINKSSVVINEIRPALKESGIESYTRYFKEFKNFEKRIQDYWDLPGLHEKGLVETFDVYETLTRLKSSNVRDYMAILGVNAVSAEDGSLFFLEHFSNIRKDLEQAKQIVLVVSLEKIVKDREAALFQTKCMGMFGLESMLLDLGPRDMEQYDFDSLPFLSSNEDRELHILILDNNRSKLLRDQFHDLFLCLDCTACARQCPVGVHIASRDWVWSPKNYLFGFLQGWVPSTEACIHCTRCHEECPVDIDIPDLIWQAQLEHYAKRGRPLKKRFMDNPELLAKVATLTSPLSNWALGIPVFRQIVQLVAGLHRHANLPEFPRQTLAKWIRESGRG